LKIKTKDITTEINFKYFLYSNIIFLFRKNDSRAAVENKINRIILLNIPRKIKKEIKYGDIKSKNINEKKNISSIFCFLNKKDKILTVGIKMSNIEQMNKSN